MAAIRNRASMATQQWPHPDDRQGLRCFSALSFLSAYGTCVWVGKVPQERYVPPSIQ